AALVDALEPAGKMVWHPDHALADALGNRRLHSRLRVALGAKNPDPAAVFDAALGRVGRIDLDEHVLHQLGQPLVGARLLAAALVIHQAAGGQDQWKLLKPRLGTRNCLASGKVGYLATRSGRDVKITSRCTGMGSARFHAIVRAFALP